MQWINSNQRLMELMQRKEVNDPQYTKATAGQVRHLIFRP